MTCQHERPRWRRGGRRVSLTFAVALAGMLHEQKAGWWRRIRTGEAVDESGTEPSRTPGEVLRAVIIGAGARGNQVFAELMRTKDIGWKVAAVVEPDELRRTSFAKQHDVPAAHVFRSLDDFLVAPRVADIAFICTPDVTHYTICAAVSRAGYDVLLEKPIATSLPDCLALLDVQQTHRNRIFVAHVLRYSPMFRTLKQIVASRQYGLVRNIRLIENIGHWHFAHSYVRGNWRRREDTAPIVLTKSSHDLDIIAWLMEKDRPAFVSSFGALEYFSERNAPPESTDRCVDCPLQDTCRYSATKFYVHDRGGWPYDVIAPVEAGVEARRRAIETGQYGRCVWRSDNNVCDNQTVTIQFESGIHATFGLYGLSAENTRLITVLLDDAEINGDLVHGRLTVTPLSGRREVKTEVIPVPCADDHHGGGDLALLRTLYEHLVTGAHSHVMSSLESSIASHVLAFLADESRRMSGSPMPVPAIFQVSGMGQT
ncbi:MAG: Gfo/Idh/MocA family oxidoreductase [Gemmatimonadetes bacterium]|nr:Gfo/Idh/MocA family oxidoreductase [Gemmatimonadota bacterium]